MLAGMDGSAFLIPLFIVAAVAMMIFHYARGESILEKWAAEQGYRVVSSERRTIRTGPYFLTTGRGRVVYRISVEDRDGHIKEGYARCGSYFLGTFSDKVDVRWDEGPPYQPGFPVAMKDRQDWDEAP